MSIQNLDQLTYRISDATDQLEVAVTAVRESAGVVEGGTGEAAQSAREAAQSARESASSASIAQQSVVMADSHRQSARAEADRASAYASQASVSADSSALSEGEAKKSASTATAQVSLAKTEANKAKAEATTATTQAGVAKAEATKATQQATTATTQAGIASTKADQATRQATIATTQASLAKQAVIDATKLEPSKDGLVEEAPKDNKMYGRVDGAWGLIPTGGGTSGGGTGAVDTVNGIAPDESGNVTVPIPQPTPQVKSDWNAITGVAEILNKPELFSGSYDDLTDKPAPIIPFSGDYNDLTNKPDPVVPFSGSYNDLKDKPTPVIPFSGNYNDLTNKPEIPVVVEQVNADWNATSGKARILNKPVLFDGRYESLTGKPEIPSGGGTSNITDNSQLTNGAGYIKDAPKDGKWYARKEGVWAEVETGKAFSGDYRDLTNKPVLNTDGSIGGNGFNGDYNDLVNKPPLITSNTQLFNGAGYIKDAVADNRQYVRKNHKWEVFESKADLGHTLFINPINNAEEGVGTRLYKSHGMTTDPSLLFNNWSHTNPHIPYPLYHLGFLGHFRNWVTDGALITPEYFSYLPSGRYSFSASSFGDSHFPNGHVLAGKTGYIEIVQVTTPQAIPTVHNNGGHTLFPTGVAYVINDNNKIVSIYDFDEKTGEFIVRASGGNSGVTPFSGRYADLSGKPTLFSGNYNDLTNKPVLFSGDYNDLINVPPPSTTGGFSGNYNDLTNKPTLFNGNYNSLTNKPTKLSQFTNDLTMTATKVVNKRTGQAMEEWVGTQAQYDAIGSKDPNTRYWITEA